MEIIDKTRFDIFQSMCRNEGYAFAYRDDHTRMEPVCHRPDRIPEGHSWGICDEAHCPYFGIRISSRNVTIHSNGTRIGKCESIEMTVVLKPEDYE